MFLVNKCFPIQDTSPPTLLFHNSTFSNKTTKPTRRDCRALYLHSGYPSVYKASIYVQGKIRLGIYPAMEIGNE